jgi:hypothetical protein
MYRVLEHIPVNALGKLYLSTAYGHTLGANRAGSMPTEEQGLHLHLREALLQISPNGKQGTLVHRVHSPEFPYRMVKGGFYIGNGLQLAHYPMPSHEVLREDHATWWRSANL